MNLDTFSLSPKWRLQRLFLCQLITLVLFVSFFSPFFAWHWQKIDTAFFTFINTPLKHNYFLCLIYGLANHDLADWFEDLCIVFFYILAIWKAPKGQRLYKTAQFCFCILFIALTIICINRLVCRDLLKLRRYSPSLVFYDVAYLTDLIPWLKAKVDSTKSFPGDHATTALLFACSYAYLVRGKLGVLALTYGVFLCLPRLAVGAHWLSDIVIGSGMIVLFSLSLAFFTPLANSSTHLIYKGLNRLKK